MSLRYPSALKAGDWASVLSGNRLHYHQVLYVEGMQASESGVIDFGAVAAATGAAAPGQTAKALQTVFQIQNYNNLLELWGRVIDDIEVTIWVPGGIQRNYMQNWQASLSRLSASIDPEANLTKFYVYGVNNDAQFQVSNWQRTALVTSRAAFWANHIALADETAEEIFRKNNPGCVPTFVPAQGWGG